MYYDIGKNTIGDNWDQDRGKSIIDTWGKDWGPTPTVPYQPISDKEISSEEIEKLMKLIKTAKKHKNQTFQGVDVQASKSREPMVANDDVSSVLAEMINAT